MNSKSSFVRNLITSCIATSIGVLCVVAGTSSGGTLLDGVAGPVENTGLQNALLIGGVLIILIGLALFALSIVYWLFSKLLRKH